MRTLYESILDDEDTIIGRTESTMSMQFFNDDNSPFYEVFYPNGPRARRAAPSPSYFRYARFDDDMLYIPHDTKISCGHLVDLNCKKLSDLWKNYYDRPINTLKINRLWINCEHCKLEVSKDTFCENIISDKVTISAPKSIHDINIIIKNLPGSSVTRHNQSFVLSNIWLANGTILKNVNVNFEDNDTLKLITIHDQTFIPLDGITSNARIIHYHDTFCLEDDGWPELFNNHILDTSYVCEIWDEQKKVVDKRKMNSLRKVIATANNPRRYHVQKDPIIKIRKDCEIGKLFGLKNMKNVDAIIIWNTNVKIYIRKGHNGHHPDTYSKDGWQIHIEKNRD